MQGRLFGAFVFEPLYVLGEQVHVLSRTDHNNERRYDHSENIEGNAHVAHEAHGPEYTGAGGDDRQNRCARSAHGNEQREQEHERGKGDEGYLVSHDILADQPFGVGVTKLENALKRATEFAELVIDCTREGGVVLRIVRVATDKEVDGGDPTVRRDDVVD